MNTKRVLVYACLLAATAGIFFACREVIRAALYAGVLAYVLKPLQVRLGRYMAPGAAALAAILVLLAALVTVPLAAYPAVQRELAAFKEALPQAVGGLTNMLEGLNGYITRAAEGLGINTQGMDIRRSMYTLLQRTLSGSKAGNRSISPANVILMPVLAYYMLAQSSELYGFFMHILPPAMRDGASALVLEINKLMRRYISNQLVVSVMVGAATALGLLAVGIRGAAALGAVMAGCNLIPLFGPFIGSVPIILFTLPSGWQGVLKALAVVLCVQQLESVVLTPRLTGMARRLHPVCVMLAVILGGKFAGLLGILLAIPAVIVIRSSWKYIYERYTMEKGLKKIESGL